MLPQCDANADYINWGEGGGSSGGKEGHLLITGLVDIWHTVCMSNINPKLLFDASNGV